MCYDLASNECKENVCICDNGNLGDCPIHNRYDCASCDYGFVRTITGENIKCERCGFNQEPNPLQTDCVPCSKNHVKPAHQDGFCDICPAHHTREIDQDECTICVDHSTRHNLFSSCAECPSDNPRRRLSDPECTRTDCPADKYNNLYTDYYCEKCPYTKVPNSAQTDCMCPEGYGEDEDGLCSVKRGVPILKKMN